MPAMLTESVIERPIFEYLDLIERHRAGRPGTSRPPRPLDHDRRRLVEFQRSLEGRAGEECWSGLCAGCGRTLISATWNVDIGPRLRRVVYCTRACRAAHGG
jgi:hypothetical protein